MLASMTGYINPATTSALPGYMSRAPWTPGACWSRIMVHGAFCELSQKQSVDIHVAAGDSDFTVLMPSHADEKMQLVAGTLNGRLAMMAIADIFFPHGLPGSLRCLLTSPAP